MDKVCKSIFFYYIVVFIDYLPQVLTKTEIRRQTHAGDLGQRIKRLAHVK